MRYALGVVLNDDKVVLDGELIDGFPSVLAESRSTRVLAYGHCVEPNPVVDESRGQHTSCIRLADLLVKG
jgi:hypothetical protein